MDLSPRVSKLLQKSTYLKLLSSEQEERCVRGSPLPLLQEGELPSQVWTLDKFHRIPVNKEKLTIFAFLTEVLWDQCMKQQYTVYHLDLLFNLNTQFNVCFISEWNHFQEERGFARSVEKGSKEVRVQAGRPKSSAQGHAELKPSTWQGARQLQPWQTEHLLTAGPGWASGKVHPPARQAEMWTLLTQRQDNAELSLARLPWAEVMLIIVLF